MEDGVVDTIIIENWQHKIGWMADFPPLLASSVFDLKKHDVPQIKSQIMRHTLMNLVNTTLFKKICRPMSIYGSVLDSCVYTSLEYE